MRQVIYCAALAASVFAAASALAAGAPAGDAAKGKADFSRVGCWECHGYEGQGGSTGPRIAAPVPLAYAAFTGFIRSTDGEMPPFTEKVLPESDLQDIFAYLQSIPKGPDPKTIPILSQ